MIVLSQQLGEFVTLLPHFKGQWPTLDQIGNWNKGDNPLRVALGEFVNTICDSIETIQNSFG